MFKNQMQFSGLNWLLFVDSYRNFWVSESAEMRALLSGLTELGSFVAGI